MNFQQLATLTFLSLIATSLAGSCDNPMITELGLISAAAPVDLDSNSPCSNVTSKSCCTLESLQDLFDSYEDFKATQKEVSDESMKSVATLIAHAKKLGQKAEKLHEFKKNASSGAKPAKNTTEGTDSGKPAKNATDGTNTTKPAKPANSTTSSGSTSSSTTSSDSTSSSTTSSDTTSTEEYDTTYEDILININETYKDTNATVQAYKTARSRCYQTLNKHKAGMNCLACSEDWANYISVSTDGNSYTVSLDEATCDLSQEACGEYFSIVAELQYLAEAVAYVSSTEVSKPGKGKPAEFTTNETLSTSLLDDLANCTNGDCQAICTQIITVTGVDETSEATLEVIVEVAAEDVDTEVDDSEEDDSEEEDSGRLLPQRILATGKITFTENGYDSVSTGEESGADVDVVIAEYEPEEDFGRIQLIASLFLMTLSSLLFI